MSSSNFTPSSQGSFTPSSLGSFTQNIQSPGSTSPQVIRSGLPRSTLPRSAGLPRSTSRSVSPSSPSAVSSSQTPIMIIPAEPIQSMSQVDQSTIPQSMLVAQSPQSMTTETPIQSEFPVMSPISPVRLPNGTTMYQPVEISTTVLSMTPALDSLRAVSSPPEFISPDSRPREDTVMEKLLRNGYLVKSRIYGPSKIAYFLVKSKLGDCFFVKIDDPRYQDTFPSVEYSGLDDIQMSKSTVAVIPQQTRVGASECLEYGICGAAFVCNTSVCVSQPGAEPTLDTFVFNSNRNIPSAMLGNSSVGYPIVNLSTLLKSPQEMEGKIEGASKALLREGRVRSLTLQDQLKTSVDQLETKIAELRRFSQVADDGLNEDIEKLETTFSGWSGIDPDQISVEDRDRYDVLVKSLSQKKELRLKTWAKLGDVQNLTKIIDGLTKEIDSVMNPVVDEVLSGLGQF